MSLWLIQVPYTKRSLMCERRRKSLKQHNDKPGRVWNTSEGPTLMDSLWQETRQMMERSEQLVHLITHVCSDKLSGIFRTCSYTRTSSCRAGQPTHDSTVADPTATGERWSATTENLGSVARNASPSDHHGIETVPPPPPGSRRARQKRNFRWVRDPPNPHNWGFLSDVVGGSEAGPPSSTSKRKHSSPSAPSSTNPSIRPSLRPSILAFLLLVASFATVTESCSSRSTPKPRPVSPTLRPNVTFQTYACPPAYAAWFCLNGATCFTVKIQDAILYNCECAEGYMGPRCEYKDLDGSYLPASQRMLLETASIAGGACVAIILVFMVLFAMYIFVHKDRGKRRSLENLYDDKRPLSATKRRAEYVCTITPLHVAPSQLGLTRSTEVLPTLSTNLRPSKDFYLLSGLDPACLCTCEQRDLSCQVVCVNHSHNYIVPTNVPKYV